MVDRPSTPRPKRPGPPGGDKTSRPRRKPPGAGRPGTKPPYRGGSRPPRAGPGDGAEDPRAGLTALGGPAAQPSRRLETFPNQHPGRRYVVTLHCPEFTCLCPVTGQPDFATITIRYVPDRRIVESKSLKLYLWSFRQEGHFHEHVTNAILDDLVRALDPISCEVTGVFNTRGGISITVEARHSR